MTVETVSPVAARKHQVHLGLEGTFDTLDAALEALRSATRTPVAPGFALATAYLAPRDNELLDTPVEEVAAKPQQRRRAKPEPEPATPTSATPATPTPATPATPATAAGPTPATTPATPATDDAAGEPGDETPTVEAMQLLARSRIQQDPALKPAVLRLISELGVDAISKIPTDKRADWYRAVQAL